MITAKSFMFYTIGKLLAPGSQKQSHFLCRVKWRHTMDHNKTNTLHVVWAVTLEQMKIKAKFFHAGTWWHSFLWSETQSNLKKEIFINVAMCTSFAQFSKFVWVVAIMAPGQLETTKPCLLLYCYMPIAKWLNSKSDSQVIPCSHKKELILSSLAQKLQSSCQLTRCYKNDDFWHPGAESFPTI